MPFDPVDQRPDFPAIEERVLQRWKDRDVFKQTLEQSASGPLFRFYDGPPTANGKPGVHHVEARVFKDVFPRFFTMKGYHVPRKAGWDCHGIPVELEVERSLGFNRKPQIEEYGVGAFNERCRESVTRYVRDWEKLTDRIGFWVDTEDPYWTMSTQYVESVWWSLKTLFDRGLLYEDYRVVPYCPRCGTALSDHEVAQGYAETEDASVYFRLEVLSGPLALEGASLVAWTTMPWTVVFSSVAVVHPDIDYVLARGGRAGPDPVVLAAGRVVDVLGPGAEVIRKVPLEELVGARYRGPFDFVGPGSADDPDGDPDSWRFVVADDWVSADTGTGIVSCAPAFGEDDMKAGRENGIPVINGVDSEGRFDQRITAYAGMYVRDADAKVIADMREAGLVIREEDYSHSFPFCWRCDTALLYYAKPSWYIRTTQFRDRLLEGNAGVDWRPAHIREGRYGNWLENNVDWALSRERYWGTPLPLWRCDQCKHLAAVGSLRELGELAGGDFSELDPHRPYVDDVHFACTSCGQGEMRRVPEVLDAWYDSGSMPFAQFGYPHVEGSEQAFTEMWPADYTAEAIDQTRGWWYSLQAISTLLFDRNSYQRALCLGHIVDANGRKMSKSVGNVLDPWAVIGDHGADALRWLLLVEGNPWQSRRVGDEPLRMVTRKLLLTIWNTYYFFVTYANLVGWTPQTGAPEPADRPVMDRYALAELAAVVGEVDAAMTDFDVTRAGRRLVLFVENLSNWYVRRSRDRFWSGGGRDEDDTHAAFATLYTCLTTLSGLLAPFVPFLADELYGNLVGAGGQALDSVHLDRFPEVVAETRDDTLLVTMAMARKLVTLGRDARTGSGVPVRQPLRRALVSVPSHERPLLDAVRQVIADELNVKSVELVGADDADLVTYKLKANFRVLGPVFGKRTQQVADAIHAADPREAVRLLRADGVFQVESATGSVSVKSEWVTVVEEPITGWRMSSDGPYSIALDLELDSELRVEGLAREFVRMLNESRKRRGFDIADRVGLRITVHQDPDGDIERMLAAHGDRIAGDVLATTVVRESELTGGTSEQLQLGAGEVLVDLRTGG